jgi:hypothetical protein
MYSVLFDFTGGEVGWNGRHNQDHGDFDSHNRQEWNPAVKVQVIIMKDKILSSDKL